MTPDEAQALYTEFQSAYAVGLAGAFVGFFTLGVLVVRAVFR